jgi:hypothetical protein
LRGATGHRAVIAIALVALGLALAACSSGPSVPGVASINSASSPHTKAKATKYPHSPLGFSLCMRAHGIADFPEPSAAGGIVIGIRPGSGSDLDPGSARFRAAFGACRSVIGLAAPSPAQKAAQLAQALKFAQCMRAHGVTDFPDPGAGGFTFRGSSNGLNPNDPVFQKASKACAPAGFFGKRRR